jgi:hypothetical protein
MSNHGISLDFVIVHVYSFVRLTELLVISNKKFCIREMSTLTKGENCDSFMESVASVLVGDFC